MFAAECSTSIGKSCLLTLGRVEPRGYTQPQSLPSTGLVVKLWGVVQGRLKKVWRRSHDSIIGEVNGLSW
jgi:hypothetical protein